MFTDFDKLDRAEAKQKLAAARKPLSGLDEYQHGCKRTFKPDMEPRDAMAMAALGLGGEAGETIDHIKKFLFHGKPIDYAKVKLEIGDVLWYVAILSTVLGFSLSEIATSNLDKLRERYPHKFTEWDAIRAAAGTN